MTANVDAMVKDAIRAYKAGKKSDARSLLEKATELDQFNEQAWLWLSAVVETDEDKRTCLENVLFINPNNDAARQGLDKLEQGRGSAKPKPAASTKSSPTSSASSSFTPDDEPSDEEYDDWANNLNIKKDDKQSGPFSAGLFDEDAFSDPFAKDAGFDDAFDDVFAQPEDDEDDDFGSYNTEDASNPFITNDLGSGPFSSSSSGALDFDFEEEEKPRGRPSSPPPVSSPPPTRAKPASTPTPSKPARSSRMSDEEDSRFFIGDDDFPVDEPDPSEYFQVIPASIRPTRLPGVNERYSVLSILGLIVLILLNIGAAAMLAMNG